MITTLITCASIWIGVGFLISYLMVLTSAEDKKEDCAQRTGMIILLWPAFAAFIILATPILLVAGLIELLKLLNRLMSKAILHLAKR